MLSLLPYMQVPVLFRVLGYNILPAAEPSRKSACGENRFKPNSGTHKARVLHLNRVGGSDGDGG
eukprot:454764-Hanusia_phi.AAC.1